MKKLCLLIIGIVFLGIAITSCAIFNIESTEYVDYVLSQTKPVAIDTNSPFYAAGGIVFTGDPATDFGANRVLIADPDDDSKSDQGTPVDKKYHEVANVYFAIDEYKIYFGHKTPEYADGSPDSKYYNAGYYMFIDNGVYDGDYSEGIKTVNAGGLAAAGVSGTLDMFDDSGVTLTNQTNAAMLNMKISLLLKHYRVVLRDMKTYRFATGAVDKANFTSAADTKSWAAVTTNAITEIAIPISYLFGDITEMPDFYVAFRCDDATTAANIDGGAGTGYPNATAVDWAPEQNVAASPTNGITLTNWIAITNL